MLYKPIKSPSWTFKNLIIVGVEVKYEKKITDKTKLTIF